MSVSNTVHIVASPLSFNLFDGVNWQEEIRKCRGGFMDIIDPDACSTEQLDEASVVSSHDGSVVSSNDNAPHVVSEITGASQKIVPKDSGLLVAYQWKYGVGGNGCEIACVCVCAIYQNYPPRVG